MTWIYHQDTGDLFHDEKFIGTGYSGRGTTRSEGRNNPDMQDQVKKGPIPREAWKIGKSINDPHMGPIAIALTPVKKADAFKRSGFFIHGDNTAHSASEGCIILGRGMRLEIVGSGDAALEVVKGA